MKTEDPSTNFYAMLRNIYQKSERIEKIDIFFFLSIRSCPIGRIQSHGNLSKHFRLQKYCM